MVESIEISEDERRELTTGREIDRPKYTFFALDHAVRYSGANRKSKLGEVQEIYSEFESENPDGDFEDWKEFYYREYGGKDKIDQATNDAYDMFLRIREAIQQLEKKDVRDFVEGIALYGTYENRNAKQAVVNKLNAAISNCEISGPGTDGDLVYEGEELLVKPESEANQSAESSERLVVTYLDKGGEIDIDVSCLNTQLTDF